MDAHGLSVLPNAKVTVTHIGVDNLRALRMPEPVELRRLTFIVGRNGIGKSTFARVFPLLRQSAESRTREPLLWWDRDQVDFGSFGEAIRRGEGGSAEEMVFTLRVNEMSGEGTSTPITYRSALCAHESIGRVRWLEVERGSYRCKMYFDASGRPEKMEGTLGEENISAKSDEIVRSLGDVGCGPENLFGFDRTMGWAGWPGMTEGIFRAYVSKLKGSAEIAGDEVYQIMYLMEDLSLADQPDLRRVSPGSNRRRPKQRTSSKSKRPSKNEDHQLAFLEFLKTEEIWRGHFLRWFGNQLSAANRIVFNLAKSTTYLGPSRMLPERGYRPRSVSIDRLDARGSNLPEFLRSLTPPQLNTLNDFVSETLDFRVNIRSEGANLIIQIERDRQTHNLVDVGFGYSQVLPVIVQLWASSQNLSNDRGSGRLSTFVIEQPELHLHPHHQVLLARAFARAAKDENGPMLIVETHSDHLIGEIGRLVGRSRLNEEHTQVLCVEPDPDGGVRLRQATFDKEGYLNNWPSGFMSP